MTNEGKYCVRTSCAAETSEELSGLVLSLGPVSYTHLDVYKRQTLYCIMELDISHDAAEITGHTRIT